MIRRIREFGSWLRTRLGEWVRSLWRTVRREPLSARVVALLGLLLALVSTLEQGFIDRLVEPPGWWEDVEGYVALGLTVALLLASAWFSADVRREKKWSEIATELRDRVMDVESLHPRTFAESLVSTAQPIKDGTEEKDLQTLVSEINKVFVEERRIPTPEDIQALEQLAENVLAETREMSDVEPARSPKRPPPGSRWLVSERRPVKRGSRSGIDVRPPRKSRSTTATLGIVGRTFWPWAPC